MGQFSRNLTMDEAFKLGEAFISFRMNDIDQGIHITLPTTDALSGEMENVAFEPLHVEYEKILTGSAAVTADAFVSSLINFARERGCRLEHLRSIQ